MKPLVLALACSLAVFIAALLALQAVAPQAREADIGSDLAREIRALHQTVKELALEAEALQGPQASPFLGAREPDREAVGEVKVPGIIECNERLIAVLDTLVVQLEKVSRTGLGNAVAAPALDELSIDALLSRKADWGLLADVRSMSNAKRTLMHLGWTMPQIVDRYGPPTNIAASPNGVGVKIYYDDPQGPDVIFWFMDGVLASAFVH